MAAITAEEITTASTKIKARGLTEEGWFKKVKGNLEVGSETIENGDIGAALDARSAPAPPDAVAAADRTVKQFVYKSVKDKNGIATWPLINGKKNVETLEHLYKVICSAYLHIFLKLLSLDSATKGEAGIINRLKNMKDIFGTKERLRGWANVVFNNYGGGNKNDRGLEINGGLGWHVSGEGATVNSLGDVVHAVGVFPDIICLQECDCILELITELYCTKPADCKANYSIFLNPVTNLKSEADNTDEAKKAEAAVAGAWSLNEERLLREALAQHGDKAWKQVAAMVPNRNERQCQKQHERIKAEADELFEYNLIKSMIPNEWEKRKEEVMAAPIGHKEKKNLGRMAWQVEARIRRTKAYEIFFEVVDKLLKQKETDARATGIEGVQIPIVGLRADVEFLKTARRRIRDNVFDKWISSPIKIKWSEDMKLDPSGAGANSGGTRLVTYKDATLLFLNLYWALNNSFCFPEAEALNSRSTDYNEVGRQKINYDTLGNEISWIPKTMSNTGANYTPFGYNEPVEGLATAADKLLPRDDGVAIIFNAEIFEPPENKKFMYINWDKRTNISKAWHMTATKMRAVLEFAAAGAQKV